MYLCETCESKFGYLEGDSRCPKHGLTSFHIEPLDGLCCAVCAEKAQRCQVCGCYVNAREYNERWMEK
jgi:hypothetical protein